MYLSLADLGGAPDVRAPHAPKFSQFHAVFLEILAKLYVGALATGNPGSASVFSVFTKL